MEKYEIAIIGAGFAGASTAWHLADKGITDVVILEREDVPGQHASSQNAGIMRQFSIDSAISRATFRGAGFILTPPFKWGKILDQVGSLLLFKKSNYKKTQKTIELEAGMGLELEVISKKQAISKISILEDAEFDYAVWTKTDGVIDVHKFLVSYLNDATHNGVTLKTGEELINVKINKDNTFTIITNEEEYKVKKIVNAAGAWAASIASVVGATNIKLAPYRRHLYSTVPMDGIDNKWPFVYDIEHKYYFRPESGGLLLCACDEDIAKPGVPSVSHLIGEMLTEKLSQYCPLLSNVSIASEWAGLRTFADDRRYVIGEDPNLKNFYWAAGLGSSGVTSSYIVGMFVMNSVIGNGNIIPKEFNAARF